MRKIDIEMMIEELDKIRNIASKQDYNTSIGINKGLIKIVPILEKELKRMDINNYEISSPVYVEITQSDCEEVDKSMQEYINNYLAELADNEVQIIDYGINYIDNVTKIGYIKYNRR